MDRMLVIHAPQKLSPGDWRVLTAAVVNLHLDYKLSPQRAVPGSPGVVLALGEIPPFLCEGVVLSDLTDADLSQKILTCIEGRDNGWVKDAAWQLSNMLGEAVVEIETERVEPKVKFE